jgi:hypothetical protein
MAATEFTFVVDGIELTDEQHAAIAQAVAAAGSLALNKTLPPTIPVLEVTGYKLDRFPIRGKYLLTGDLAVHISEQLRDLPGGR